MGIKIPGLTGSAIPPELIVTRHEPPAAMDGRADVRPEARGDVAPEAPASLSAEEVRRSAELLEQTFRLFNKKLRFSVNEEINRVVVKVLDAKTDKLIKEIPPAEIQRLIARIKETIGLLFDEQI
jgi:flagellar protein FlaG